MDDDFCGRPNRQKPGFAFEDGHGIKSGTVLSHDDLARDWPEAVALFDVMCSHMSSAHVMFYVLKGRLRASASPRDPEVRPVAHRRALATQAARRCTQCPKTDALDPAGAGWRELHYFTIENCWPRELVTARWDPATSTWLRYTCNVKITPRREYIIDVDARGVITELGALDDGNATAGHRTTHERR